MSLERLLTFEVAGSVYGLPISDIAEVAEVGALVCIPSVSPRIGVVTNLHGDALPVIRRGVLFGVEESSLDEPQHLLVLAPSKEESARVGVPVDRVLGLADGRAVAAANAAALAAEAETVTERQPIDGRVVQILDTHRLIERAGEAIACGAAGSTPLEGGIP